MTIIEQQLKDSIQGDVHFDPISLRAYSVDASIYEIEPIAIVIPKTKQDIIHAINIAHSHSIPVIARGAATGITGGCLGKGIIIDTSKYLSNIISIDLDKQLAVCEPGVIQDQLNEALAEKGPWRLGPDTSTGNRATIGGMAANNAAGARSLRYGKMVDHVEKVEMALANGDLISFQAMDHHQWEAKCAQQDREGIIYREISRMINTYREEIATRFPHIPRRVSGYNLDELIKPFPLNLAKLIVGSEGTLGIITEITVKISPKPKTTGICILHFDDMLAAMQWIPHLLSYHPLSLEMIDDAIIKLGKHSPSMRGKLGWIQGDPQAVFVIEFDADTPDAVKQKIDSFIVTAKNQGIGYAQIPMTQSSQIDNVWALRKAGLGILMSKRSYSRAIAFIEDITIAPENLAAFMEQFCHYLKSKGKEAGIYGHVGSGCMHIRPYIDLRQPEELALMDEMLHAVSDLVLKYGGAMSGEHGDGIIRSWLNPKMYGSSITQAFADVKAAFDPDNRMNPGKIVHPADHLKNLRLSPDSLINEPATFLDFSKEGGFALAVDMCNGNGLCRKREGLMCPSFQVDNDEYHSTRARAQALRSIVHGQLKVNNFTNQDVYDVLDLCISCKGCKTECPSQVDMAKMKAEFLYQYQEVHGYPIRSRLFAYIGRINRLLSPFASLVNRLGSTAFGKWMQELIGISSQRTLPSLATQRLSQWFANYPQPNTANTPVVLFNDTFTEFNHPEIGQAAIKILNDLGFHVFLPSWKCCGRPHLSKGMLEQAQKHANTLVDLLFPYASQGFPIIGLEPSCLLMIKDDFPDFINKEALSIVIEQCITLDEFLAKLIEKGQFNLGFRNEPKQVLVHGHCHQKALIGMKPMLTVLKAIPGFQVTEIPSGCCGMAGSFGYEKEHYDFSMKIGNTSLFPTIDSFPDDAIIVANGTSCRSQISDGTQRQAKHLAEVIYDRIQPLQEK